VTNVLQTDVATTHINSIITNGPCDMFPYLTNGDMWEANVGEKPYQ